MFTIKSDISPINIRQNQQVNLIDQVSCQEKEFKHSSKDYINFFNQIGKSVLLCKIETKKRDEVNRARCFSVCGTNPDIDEIRKSILANIKEQKDPLRKPSIQSEDKRFTK